MSTLDDKRAKEPDLTTSLSRKMTSLSILLKPNAIHAGDCVELLKQMEDGSVDLLFADPPFNIGYEYDQYDDQQTSEDYLDWCEAWITQTYRVLKPTGSFWLAIGDEYAAELKVLCQTSWLCATQLGRLVLYISDRTVAESSIVLMLICFIS